MYIMDEEDFIRNIISSGKKPNDLSFGYFISLIAKYYKSNCDNVEDLLKRVIDSVCSFKIAGYQEYKYAQKIYSICSTVFSTDTGFKKLKSISIYKNDIDVITSLPDNMYKKLMFTMYAIARYMDCDGWINKKTANDIADMFKLANVNVSKDRQSEMLHYLYEQGYITFAKSNTNQNIKLDISVKGDTIIEISNFNNLGKQYMLHFSGAKAYKECKQCHAIFHSRSVNQMYCKNCKKENDLERYKKYNKTR